MGTGSSAAKAGEKTAAGTAASTPAAATEEKPMREAVSNVVKDLETLVIEIGADGTAIERGCAPDVAQQIFVVVDPRAGRAVGEVKCLSDAATLRKLMMGGGGKTTLKIFLLVPSTTSSKACLMNAHMAVLWMGHWAEQGDVMFIRSDDYYHNGDVILNAMVAEDKAVYPAEERENMMAVFTAVSKCMWPKRAYVHWPVGGGLEEDIVCTEQVIAKIGPIFSDESRALARIGDAPSKDIVATQAVLATGQRPVFLAFSEESATSFQEKCEGTDIIIVTEDIFALVESGDLDGELGGLAAETAYPVLLAGPSDIAGNPEVGSQTLFNKFVSKWRETKPCMSLCVVLVDESADAFKQNCWMVFAMHTLVENADMVVLATTDEVQSAVGFFSKARYPEADVAKTAMFQLIPFPRIHFYTMGTALGGAELEDSEIWLPAVTVGPVGGNASLPAKEKFRTVENFAILPDFPAENHELIIPGQDGYAGATLIHPAKLLASIFTGVCTAMHDKVGDPEGGLTWAGVFGEDFGGEDIAITEAEANLNDLVSEMTQYLECNITEEECEE